MSNTYRNVHTGEVRTIVSSEVVSNPPITVYVLDNGNRWDSRQFSENWQLVPREETPMPDTSGTQPHVGRMSREEFKEQVQARHSEESPMPEP